MNMNDRLKKETEYANRVLEDHAVLMVSGSQKTVIDAMNYSILAGGKRLRPIFMKAAYDLYEGENPCLDTFMAAIEMIHTYSLVHDDLPAMDNDLYRRGKKTTHAVYGEDMAILTGDALLNRAYEIALSAVNSCREVNDKINAVKALSVLSEKAGIYGMVGGQVFDVEAEKKGIELNGEDIDFIFRLKTAALIEAPLMMGAILSGAPGEDVKTLEMTGRKVGLAFQIRDDILDVTGDEKELGKPVFSDKKNNKRTYVDIYGLEKSEKDCEALSREAVKLLGSLGRDTGFLEELVLSLIDRRK
ncbi:MAG: polyprenyl synthetase family protein [Lachnospiraceae bacterium]|nr:polyprenyl synthetase family protein [Lachnospiraceae bacterium]